MNFQRIGTGLDAGYGSCYIRDIFRVLKARIERLSSKKNILGWGRGERMWTDRWAGRITFVAEFCSLVEKWWCEC